MQIDNGFLRGDAKQEVNEGTLTEYIAFRQPADLTFADHVHRLITVHGESSHFGPVWQFTMPITRANC
jgi:hypothetical protein